MEEQIISAAIDTVTPVFESAIVLAGQYAKATGRDVLTSKDVEYAMKYCTQHVVGNRTGSMFPELYEDEDSDEEEPKVIEDENEEIFCRYTGSDELLNAVNTAYDNWDQWEPSNLIETMLKNAIELKKNSFEE